MIFLFVQFCAIGLGVWQLFLIENLLREGLTKQDNLNLSLQRTLLALEITVEKLKKVDDKIQN